MEECCDDNPLKQKREREREREREKSYEPPREQNTTTNNNMLWGETLMPTHLLRLLRPSGGVLKIKTLILLTPLEKTAVRPTHPASLVDE